MLAMPFPPQDAPSYELYYLKVHGRRQDTLTYDFNGDGRSDLLNTSVNYDDDPPTRWLAWYIRDEQGMLPRKPNQQFQVDDRVCALVFGNFVPSGGIECGFLAADGFYVYTWTGTGISETPRKLLHLRTFFSAPPAGDLLVWQYRRDLDGNGLNDLVVPLPDGYRIFFQTEPGIFGHIQNLEEGLEKSADRSLGGDRYAEHSEKIPSTFILNRELPRITIVDINGDGRDDLVTIRKNKITYFMQRPVRQFQSNRRNRFRYSIPTLDTGRKKNRIDVPIVDFVDINSDGKADMIVTRVVGELGMLESLETRVYLHIGTGRGNFVSDQVIQVRGVTIDPTFVDMNQDGKLDCMVSRLRTDLMRQGGQLLVLGEIRIAYEIFQFDGDSQTFKKDPVFEKIVRISTDDLKNKSAANVPLVFVSGDLSGDGRPDMVVINPGEEEIRFHYGEVHWSGGKEVIGFESTPFFRKKLDRYPKRITVEDLNDDGLDDVILKHNGEIGILESRRKK
jgi:hypothetical protein